MKINKLSALLFALAAGCTPEVAQWTPAQSPKENKVDRAIFTYVINYPARASSLDKREKRELMKYLKATVGSPLAVSIIIEEFGGHSEKRIKDIERELLRFGIPYDLITVEFDQDGGQDRHQKHHKHHKNRPESGVMLTIERYIVIPPSCGDFSQPIGDAQQAYAHSNHGCADTANLGLMVANPRDLAKGRALGDSDGAVLAAGVDRYRKDKTKALIDTSTNVAPGTTGTTASGASASAPVGGAGGVLVMADSSPDTIQLMAFLEDEKDIAIIRDAFKETNIKNTEVIKGGVREAIDLFAHQRSPQYLIIDISKSDLPVSDLNRLAEVCEPGVSLIAVGRKNDVGLYRDLMKLGIFEYVVSPLLSEIIGRALKNMILGEEKGKESHSRSGKIIAVAGSRGGVGSTFIATNLAAILASEKFRRVVIVDLDLHYGTVSLYLDLKPNYGLRNALEDPDRVDQVFLERLLISVNEHLYALSSEEPLEEPLKYRVEGVENLLKYLSKIFHYVIVDVPHISDESTLVVLENAKIMVLVTDPSLAGLRDSGRLVRLFGAEGVDHRILFVMNKCGAFRKGEVSVVEYEEAMNRKITHSIPFDSLTAMECANRGKTLVEVDSPLANSIRKIADEVQGIKEVEKKQSAFDRFFQSIKLK